MVEVWALESKEDKENVKQNDLNYMGVLLMFESFQTLCVVKTCGLWPQKCLFFFIPYLYVGTMSWKINMNTVKF